jgi:hypothetical protein
MIALSDARLENVNRAAELLPTVRASAFDVGKPETAVL